MRIILALLGALCCASATAHDFWVQPDAFWLEPRAVTPLSLQVGHGPARQRSPIPLRRITRFAAIAPDGTAVDLRARLQAGEIGFEHPGTHVLVLETGDAQSYLPSVRFNDYLQVEGLTPALLQRARTGRTDANGSERYSRRAKALVQVGPPTPESQAQVTKPLGLTLEIVPEQNPYAEPRPARLPVRVFYEGQPLADALVKFTNLEHDAEPFEMQRTDDTGRASFIMPKDGAWLLNVIWTKPSRDTDFETVFSSLSFGFLTQR